MILNEIPQDEPRPDADELARRLRLALKSPRLSKEQKSDLSRMWGFARILDAAVAVALEDEGF